MMDAVTAVVQVLQGESVADGRIFGGRLPASEQPEMPRTCVIVRPAGGQQARSYMTTVADRVDVRTYGASEYESHQLTQQVSALLHQVNGDQSIRWARREGGPTAITDSADHWPFELSSWLVYGPWLEPDD